MQRRCFTSVLFLSLFLLTGSVFAANPSPVAQLRSVADRMITQLAQYKRDGKLTSPEIKKIVNQVLLPEVDVSYMAGSVLGRQYWVSANANLRKQFIQELTNLVICTYSSALSSFDDDKVEFYPLRVNYQNTNVLEVNSVIVRPNGQRIPISYNVILRGKQWKIFDFSIENVSIVQNYRAQFAGVLASSGVAGLVTKIRSRNKETGCT